MKFSMTGQEKDDLLIVLNTGDCLIEVTTWADLTILNFFFGLCIIHLYYENLG